MGHLEEAAMDLGVALEMTEEEVAKANLCQKLVGFKLFLRVIIFPQPFTVSFDVKADTFTFPGCSKAL